MGLLLFKLFLLTGYFNVCDSVIDWAVAIGAASTAAASVTSGASMIHNMAGAPGYRVVCTIVTENWTKYPLVYPATHINGGMLKSSPVAVLPLKRESFIARKTAHRATGTYGTASWLISGQNRRVVVMWSCPFNFDHYKNWLGVGITGANVTDHQKDWFDQMYYKNSTNNLNFVRGEYYYNTQTLSITDSKFEITGTMGTTHKAKAHIIIRPLFEADLAPQLKTAVGAKIK